MKKTGLIIFLLFCVFSLGAQDLITRNDGTHIYCRIVKVDSAFITYKTPQLRDEQIISKTLVQSYYQSSSAARNPVEPVKKSNEAPEIFLLKFIFGSSRPVAEFARQDANDENAGLATGGLAGGIEAIVKVHKFIGISFAYKFQNNRFNVDAIVDELRSQAPMATFTGEAEDWKMRGLFAGLHFCVPFPQPEGLWLTLDAGGGLPKFVYPEISITGNPQGVPVTVEQSASKTSSPAITAGVGLRYKASRVVAFTMNVDFYRAQPTFRVITTNNYGFYDTNSYEQRIRTVNICIGATFCFYGRSK